MYEGEKGSLALKGGNIEKEIGVKRGEGKIARNGEKREEWMRNDISNPPPLLSNFSSDLNHCRDC